MTWTLLIVIAVLLNVGLLVLGKRTRQSPFVPEWKLDEGVELADEGKAEEILRKYGQEAPIVISDDIVVHNDIKAFVSRYATLDFDDYTRDYTREELLKGEEQEPMWKGYYCIGGDGGEISFFVRKSLEDEKVYAFDMEGSSRPEPYASNIRRFVVMRYEEWEKGESM